MKEYIEQLRRKLYDAVSETINNVCDDVAETRTFSAERDGYVRSMEVDDVRDDMLLRVFGHTEESKEFEKSKSLFSLLCLKYELYNKDTENLAEIENRRINYYSICRGKELVGYYGFQHGIKQALLNITGKKDINFTKLIGFDLAPDYFVLTKRRLVIIECKYLSRIAKPSNYLRQAGVCHSFAWLCETKLSSVINMPVSYFAILSPNFKGTPAENYLKDNRVVYSLDMKPTLSYLGL